MVKKGQVGYIKNRRTYTLLRTVLFFGLSLAIFLTGYFTTHTQANLLTIVAVLGVLPSSKSAVAFIMYLRARPVPEGLKDECDKLLNKAGTGSNVVILYELYLTTYDKNYPLDAVCLREGGIAALAAGAYEGKPCFSDVSGAAAHIERVLSLDGIRDISIKIFLEPEGFYKRVREYCERAGEQAPAIKTGESIMRVAL